MLRIGVSIGVAFGTALVAAIAVALLELYLSGHGYASVATELLSWPAAGVYLSPGDLVVLSAAALGFALTWVGFRANRVASDAGPRSGGKR